MLAVGNPSSRPRRSPATTSPRSWNGEPRKRAACSTSPASTSARMWLEETTSPSTSTSVTTRVSNADVGRAAAPGRRAARWPKRKFSPTDTRVACSRLDEHLVDELLRALRARSGRRTGSRPARRRRASAISSALASRLVSSFGAASGRITASGCGSNVSTVSLPAITSRWPRWTPSNSPTATRRGRGSRVHELRHLHRGGSLASYRRADHRPQLRPAPAGLGERRPARRRRSGATVPRGGIAARIDRAAVADSPPACASSSSTAGRKSSASTSAIGRSGSASATSKAPIRVRRSCSQ